MGGDSATIHVVCASVVSPLAMQKATGGTTAHAWNEMLFPWPIGRSDYTVDRRALGHNILCSSA